MTRQLTPDDGQPLTLALHSPPTFWRCEPSWYWQSRPLPDHLLWCVLDGRGQLQMDGRERELGPGICAVFGPGDEPLARHDPKRRLLVFGMHFEVAADVLPEPRWGEVADRVLLGELARGADTAYRRGSPAGRRQAELYLEQLLHLVWEAATRPSRGRIDVELEEIAQAMRQDPGRQWTVAELAARAALSRAQFTRRFTKQFGASPAQYVIQARVDRAHQLLNETSMSVTQVAAALGYTDVPYFSRQYKQRTGRTPRDARS
ncbi:AraC family transcriptional regulator [Kribbella deserti]|uniref:Helix-turn-helix domain-containing protein n=1 Tax=Kribbella deserti TaxID=1926257 RepID=A0ABV6QUZ7_9ACTN